MDLRSPLYVLRRWMAGSDLGQWHVSPWSAVMRRYLNGGWQYREITPEERLQYDRDGLW